MVLVLPVVLVVLVVVLVVVAARTRGAGVWPAEGCGRRANGPRNHALR